MYCQVSTRTFTIPLRVMANPFEDSSKQKNPGWGGSRPNAGRKRKQPIEPMTVSATARTRSFSPVQVPPLSTKFRATAAVPATGFFAPGTRSSSSHLTIEASTLARNTSGSEQEPNLNQPSSPSKVMLLLLSLCYLIPVFPALLSHLTATEYAQLTDQINFVENHDEHADIASGSHVIDESIADEILDLPEELPSADNSEAQQDSAICQYLSSTLHEIKKQISKHKRPDCYSQGDFYIRPKHPVFALHDAAVGGFRPDHLCHRDIFVWLPAYLPCAPRVFKCMCNKALSKNGELK